MIISYCDDLLKYENGEQKREVVNRLALLAMSTMAKVPGRDDEDIKEDDGDEIILFNVDARLSFFRDNFRFFGQEFDEWCLCVILDN